MTVYVPYALTLRSPLLVTGSAGDPNGARTLPFIPGTAMRGAIAARLGDPDRTPAVRESFERFVLSGDVAYLNAYPAAGGVRTLPVPLSWRRRNYGDEVFDMLCADVQEAGSKPADFFAAGEAPATYDTVQIRITSRTHQSRDRARGFPASREEGGTGTIFTYDALDAGQTFIGVVRCHDAADVAELMRLVRAGETLLFGRSRRAGYGGDAVLSWGEPRDREVPGSLGLVARGASIRVNERARLLLLSPCIVRHPITGQLDPSALYDELIARIGMVAIGNAATASTTIRGYNRKWRLHLPEAPAMDAGSVIELIARVEVPSAVLAALEDDGIGERRAEGFGRLVFLGPPEHVVTLRTVAAETIETDAALATEPPLLLRVQERILLARLDRAIDVTAAEVSESARRLPTVAILGRLTLPLRRSPRQGLQTLAAWLGSPPETQPLLRRPAINQLDACVVVAGGRTMPLTHVLRECLQQPMSELPIGAGTVVDQARLTSLDLAHRALDAVGDQVRARLITTILRQLMKRVARTRAGDDPDV